MGVGVGLIFLSCLIVMGRFIRDGVDISCAGPQSQQLATASQLQQLQHMQQVRCMLYVNWVIRVQGEWHTIDFIISVPYLGGEQAQQHQQQAQAQANHLMNLSSTFSALQVSFSRPASIVANGDWLYAFGPGSKCSVCPTPSTADGSSADPQSAEADALAPRSDSAK